MNFWEDLEGDDVVSFHLGWDPVSDQDLFSNDHPTLRVVDERLPERIWGRRWPHRSLPNLPGEGNPNHDLFSRRFLTFPEEPEPRDEPNADILFVP